MSINTLDELKEWNDQLTRMLANPEPGLFTWNMMLQKHLDKIRLAQPITSEE